MEACWDGETLIDRGQIAVGQQQKKLKLRAWAKKIAGATCGKHRSARRLEGSSGKVSQVELRDRQAMWDGFANALTQAAEFVVAPLLFALVGHFLDTRFDTGPVLAIAFGLLGLFGVAARAYYGYRASMDREEEGKPWTRSRP